MGSKEGIPAKHLLHALLMPFSYSPHIPFSYPPHIPFHIFFISLHILSYRLISPHTAHRRQQP